MKKTIFMFWLFLYLTTARAQTFEPPVIIDPPNPIVGDTIRVGVFEHFYPPCLFLPGQNQDGLTHLFEINNNNIDLFVVNSLTPPICNPFPVSPAPREWYELGNLEEGIYSLNTTIVSVVHPLPIPPNFPPLPNFGPKVIFQVSAPKIVDTFTIIGILILMLILMMLGIKKIST